MDRKPGATTAALLGMLCGAAVLITATPVAAQAPPPGSTINGTVPTAQGNVWNGLDHQPTPSQAAPIGNARQQARVNRQLGKLDRQLLNAPLPKAPQGAPSITTN